MKEGTSILDWYRCRYAYRSLEVQAILWLIYGFLWIPAHYLVERHFPDFSRWYEQSIGRNWLIVQIILWFFYGYIWIPLLYVFGKWLSSMAKEKEGKPHNKQRNGGDSRSSEPSLEACFKSLEVSPETSPEAVKSAYRRRMQEYHPDKVVLLGKEIREMAERKSKEITIAYRFLKLQGYAR